MEEIQTFTNSNLQLTEESKSFLKETAKWAHFLSILGFIGVGIMVLIAFFVGTIFSNLGLSGERFGMIEGGLITVIYLFLAAIYFFPVYYLFQFSSKAKLAFSSTDNEKLTASFEYLKSHYKFMGILVLVFFSLYGIIFFVSLIGMIANF